MFSSSISENYTFKADGQNLYLTHTLIWPSDVEVHHPHPQALSAHTALFVVHKCQGHRKLRICRARNDVITGRNEWASTCSHACFGRHPYNSFYTIRFLRGFKFGKRKSDLHSVSNSYLIVFTNLFMELTSLGEGWYYLLRHCKSIEHLMQCMSSHDQWGTSIDRHLYCMCECGG